MKTSRKSYAIGDISDMCNVPIKTLRYYDEIGLLVPDYRDPTTNYRYYSEDQMLTLYIIRRLKMFGFTLEEIRNLVYNGDIGVFRKSLSNRVTELDKEIEDLFALKHEIGVTLERMKQGSDFIDWFNENGDASDILAETPSNGIRVEYIPETGYVFTRKNEENYQNAYVSVARWFEVFAIIKKYHLKSAGVITLTYHNEPLGQFFQKDCDLEVSIPVEGTIDKPFYGKRGGYDAVIAMHVGSHSKIINTHIKVLRWINQHNYEVIGPISEEYIVSPLDVKSEDNYLSKIIIPVKRK